MTYLDNAATSFPKPKETIAYLNDFVLNKAGNPGRSGHTLSLEAARVIFEAREGLVEFINGKGSERLIFTQNGTESLNLAILGLLREGDHVITTSMEHNSVMRPLMFLKKDKGIEISILKCSGSGELDPDALKRAIKRQTKAVIINHGSNVTGAIQPLRAIRKTIGEICLIVDACQTIGSVEVDIEMDGIDILCFSCHKSLYSIQGLGAIYIKAGLSLKPLRFGGTGSRSESIEQPEFLPDRYESGTPNTPAIASLLGGLTFIKRKGLGEIIERKKRLREMIIKGLSEIDGVFIYGPGITKPSIPIISFNINGMLPSDVGHELNRVGIYTRIGLHCSPLAHKTIGTFPQGSVRVSPGYLTGEDEIRVFLEAVRGIAKG